jgi:hypothetical protein
MSRNSIFPGFWVLQFRAYRWKNEVRIYHCELVATFKTNISNFKLATELHIERRIRGQKFEKKTYSKVGV